MRESKKEEYKMHCLSTNPLSGEACCLDQKRKLIVMPYLFPLDSVARKRFLSSGARKSSRMGALFASFTAAAKITEVRPGEILFCVTQQCYFSGPFYFYYRHYEVQPHVPLL